MIPRPLEELEQLDLSYFGQDSGQLQEWACGTYLMNYGTGTPAGCHEIPNGGVAACVRLWRH